MPFVTILPNEKLCPQGAKIEVKTACATCHVIVKEGFESLGEPSDDEYDQLDNAFGATSESRLACQTVMGDKDITIEIPKNNRNLVNE